MISRQNSLTVKAAAATRDRIAAARSAERRAAAKAAVRAFRRHAGGGMLLRRSQTTCDEIAARTAELFACIKLAEVARYSNRPAHKVIGDAAFPTLAAFVERFNRISAWATSSVLAAGSSVGRMYVVRKLVKVAVKLARKGDLSSAMAVSAGLGVTPVDRVVKVKDALPGGSELLAAYEREVLSLHASSKNFSAYRGVLRARASQAAHTVPHLGTIQKDMHCAAEARALAGGAARAGWARDIEEFCRLRVSASMLAVPGEWASAPANAVIDRPGAALDDGLAFEMSYLIKRSGRSK